MRCRLSPTADVPSHTSGAATCQERQFAPQQVSSLFDPRVRAGENYRQRLIGSKSKRRRLEPAPHYRRGPGWIDRIEQALNPVARYFDLSSAIATS